MKGKTPLIVMGVLALVFVAFLAMQPRPVDWRPDLRRTSNKALGAEILAELLPVWLAVPGGEAVQVASVNEPPFLHLADESFVGTTYLFLTDDFSPDDAEAERLYRYAERGNLVFIAAQTVSGALADTLGAPGDSEQTYLGGLDFRYESLFGSGDSTLQLVNPALERDEGFTFSYDASHWVISGLDSVRTDVLGTSMSGQPTLVRVSIGKGAFVLSSTPYAFGNAAFTGKGDGADYVAGVLGYLPAQPVFWDEYYKPFAVQAQSTLRVILREPPLNYALQLILLGVVLLILFRGRRWQRAVPVVSAPANATLEFVRTVGRLYFQHADHAALIERRLRYFFDRIRTRLGLADLDLSEATERRVAARSGVSEEHIASIFAHFRRLRGSAAIDRRHLVDLDRSLDRFYDSVGR